MIAACFGVWKAFRTFSLCISKEIICQAQNRNRVKHGCGAREWPFCELSKKKSKGCGVSRDFFSFPFKKSGREDWGTDPAQHETLGSISGATLNSTRRESIFVYRLGWSCMNRETDAAEGRADRAVFEWRRPTACGKESGSKC